MQVSVTKRRQILVGSRLPAAANAEPSRPDWQQASPAWIAGALRHAAERSPGGWYVLDAARAIEGPRPYRVAGRELVAWRADGQPRVAPEACPHLGARLSEGRVCGGRLACPWHDLTLGPEGHGGWKPLPVFDDGVLLWVQLPDRDPPAERPRLAPRPQRFIDAVVRREAACDARDVLANRLDPWHGAHYHPHSFATLRVLEQAGDAITVRVVYRLVGAIAVEVDARFHCPDARSIVMTIVAGEGLGSVVETHATPIDPGRTAIIEATLATSDRAGFALARRAAGLLRPWIRRAAARLWIEDAAYAERLYELRQARQGATAAG
ncbi:MAG: Rieske 2Fe-2S domain-containing protein [Proteobacteria bacterium]|nr:Rieske 2Fe-2S domain-containing protein [Pseudomonadota bacterium]